VAVGGDALWEKDLRALYKNGGRAEHLGSGSRKDGSCQQKKRGCMKTGGAIFLLQRKSGQLRLRVAEGRPGEGVFIVDIVGSVDEMWARGETEGGGEGTNCLRCMPYWEDLEGRGSPCCGQKALGSGFSAQRRVPDCCAKGKRPEHSISDSQTVIREGASTAFMEGTDKEGFHFRGRTQATPGKGKTKPQGTKGEGRIANT